jgi:hypothetical protein
MSALHTALGLRICTKTCYFSTAENGQSHVASHFIKPLSMFIIIKIEKEGKKKNRKEERRNGQKKKEKRKKKIKENIR